MGCTGSKQEKSDFSDSSFASESTIDKSTNRKPLLKSKIPPSLSTSSSSSRKQVKSNQIKAKKPATKKAKPVPADETDDIQNGGDQIDGSKMSMQPPKSTSNRAKSTQSTAATRKTGWTDEQLLSQLQYLDFDTSSNIVRLFDEGNTIPFMCRYRRELIGNLDADK